MSLKQILHRQLIAARETSEKLLEDFHTPEQWTKQVCDGSNHALWFAGHMGVSDNFWISLIAPERSQENAEFQRLFGLGSQPSANPQDYPSPEEVLQVMRERRQVLLEILADLTEEDLARPTPAGTPEFLPDLGGVLETAIWHEGLHSGQLTVHRRALGHQPLQ
ncbi:DinB family protein [Lignipirellula cremea]|uniref:DinB superfamily protein n=1 Tax=Lignipirellula cremea TaxID=2528010 RepID=A0A518DP23_9BACT|nr:DinB family protein [Lignipirellula cremea]QDU93576.1 DinB superfamily protein [Lignipirellula cremea]